LKSFSVKLAGFDNYMLYVPRGFAHGYITLRNHSNIVYLSTNFYSSKHESGIRYNDPLIGIKWPNKVTKISEKDRNWDFIIE
jgi:dTDP-4-dehydrorhamnose 3,5-epimerase